MQEEKLYIPKSYLTVQIVRDVMAEFEWPVSYELIDETEDWRSVIIKFENCEIELTEVPGEGIHLEFLSFNNGKKLNAKYGEIIQYIENYNPREHLDLERKRYNDRILHTISAVRNKMKNLQYYHMDFITGTNYSWAEKYLKDKKK
ncbi:hypothetical protein [Kordia sp.]|uniref:hypothetical protein n=1 Tax=Kordia sp. TaxID=1965332 RepID=UPI003D6BD0E2